MFPWERLVCRSPPLKPCRTNSDRMRIALSKSMLDNFWALLEKGVNINKRDQQNKTPLHLVIEWKKDLELVKAVISADADPNAVDGYGHTPLHAAIYSFSSPAIIKALLNAGADIEMPDVLGRSPLTMSIQENSNILVIQALLSDGADVFCKNLMVDAVKAKRSPEVIKLLITAGAPVNYTRIAIPPLSYAVENDDPEVVKLLLLAGANVKRNDIMAEAVKTKRSPEVIKLLIKAGASVNYTSTEISPLLYAVKNGDIEVVKLLLSAGANAKCKNLLAEAVKTKKSPEVIKLLIRAGASVNYTSPETPPLSYAVKNGDLEAVKLLLSAGANAKRNDLMAEAVKTKSSPEAIRLLIRAGASVNYSSTEISPLSYAIKNDDLEVVKLLLSAGASMMRKDLITEAVKTKSNPEIIRLLIKAGASINYTSAETLPLSYAVKNDDLEVVKMLLSAGANVNCKNFMAEAVKTKSSPEVIRLLLNAGASVNVNSTAIPPLLYAVKNDDLEVVKMLLSAGANVNSKNFMAEAVKTKSRPEVIRLLLQAGASVNVNSTAIPPLSYAVENDDLEVVQLLLSAGARIDFLHSETQSSLLHLVKSVGVAEELIMYGMDVDAVNKMGKTPLHVAVSSDLLDLASTLIKAGADVRRLVRYSRDNCLHLAESKPMVRMLASHGVNINARNCDGSTPLLTLLEYCNLLQVARNLATEGETYRDVKRKYISAIKEMLIWGADVNATDDNGTRVYELATLFGSTKVMLYLINYGMRIYWDQIIHLDEIFTNSITRLVRDWVIRNYDQYWLIINNYLLEEKLVPFRIPSLLMYVFRCKEEIELMKVKKINCHDTIYYYMVEIAPKVKTLRLCPHIKISDKDCKATFPIYKNKIMVRLDKCYRRGILFDILEKADVSAPTAEGKGVVSLITDCKFAIAEYLSNEDLFFFLLAMGIKVSKDTVCPKFMNCGNISPLSDN